MSCGVGALRDNFAVGIHTCAQPRTTDRCNPPDTLSIHTTEQTRAIAVRFDHTADCTPIAVIVAMDGQPQFFSDFVDTGSTRWYVLGELPPKPGVHVISVQGVFKDADVCHSEWHGTLLIDLWQVGECCFTPADFLGRRAR